MRKRLILLAFAAMISPAPAALIITETYFSAPNAVIPDGDLSGVVQTINTTATSIGSLAKVTVGIVTTGGWNGDLYAYLSHQGTLVTLLNRIGRSAASLDGSGSSGMSITLDDAASSDIHLASGVPLSGTYQADGRQVSPWDAMDTTARTAFLSAFNATSAGGLWQLYMADTAGGDEATWANHTLTLTGEAALSSGDLIKNGAHTTIVAGPNTFTGRTFVNEGLLTASGPGALTGTTQIVINDGTLLLGGAGPDRLADNAPITLAGGSLATGGLNETLGSLSLSGAGGVIDLGAGIGGILSFADSSLASWTGLLRIWNWNGFLDGGGAEQIRFGDGATTGLTAAQLAQVRFYSDGGLTLLPGSPSITAIGELIPVPELGANAALTAIFLLGLALRRECRRERI